MAKCKPLMQDGARNFQFLLDLSHDLPEADQMIVQRVMADNAHWCHPENVAIGCLSDPDETVRRRGVQYILEARRLFDKEGDVRKFVSPEINFKSEKFYSLVDLESSEKWEPPVTKDLSEEEILSALAKPLLLPSFPSNTQRVEQMVRVVTEAAMTRVSYDGRQRLIVQKLKSRKLVKSFNSKMQDAHCD